MANRKQKRELRKKRHARQQYLKYEAPLDRLEAAIAVAQCQSVQGEYRCMLKLGHRGTDPMCVTPSLAVISWSDPPL